MNRQYGDKIRFLAINIAVGDTLKKVRLFMDLFEDGLTVLYDKNREVSASYKVLATPSIVFVDEKGVILSVAHTLSSEDVRSLLSKEDD